MIGIFGIALLGVLLFINMLEQPTRIGAPIGTFILLLLIIVMIGIGIVGLVRARDRK